MTTRQVHRSLVFALGLRETATALDDLATTDGYAFDTPKLFGATLLRGAGGSRQPEVVTREREALVRFERAPVEIHGRVNLPAREFEEAEVVERLRVSRVVGQGSLVLLNGMVMSPALFK